jgi:hypothetical protein
VGPINNSNKNKLNPLISSYKILGISGIMQKEMVF